MTFVGDSSAPVCPWPARHLRGAWNASETFDTVGCMHIPTQREIRYQWERGGPVMTWALIVACVAVWLLEVLLGFIAPGLRAWLMYLGMAAPVRLVAEPWTLITSMFLHAPNSLLHILFNMIALYSVGPVLERMIGHWRFLGLYVISGLGGSLGLMVWAAVAPGGIGWQMAAYGASGALFGLFASLLVVYRRIGADIRSMLIWMAVNFALPFVVGGVAWQAHVGGFVVGGILTWLLVGGVPAWRGKSLKWRMQVYGWAMVVLVIALILLCNMANPYGWMSCGSLGLMVWAAVAPGGIGWQMAAYGASGALFGLFASLLVVYRRIGADIRSMLIWMAVNFALPFVVGGVAWQAHVGGFVVGGILTWLLVGGVPAWRGKSLKWRMQVYGWAMVVLVIALILLCNMANPYGWMSFGSLH